MREGERAGGYETYVAKLGEEPNLEVFSVYEMDLETGEIRYNGSTEYTLVSPAKELTLSDVCIKLGSDVYPMWIVDELVDSHAGFMTGLMGGNPSATLPIQPIKKTGNWHTVCRMISRVLT